MNVAALRNHPQELMSVVLGWLKSAFTRVESRDQLPSRVLVRVDERGVNVEHWRGSERKNVGRRIEWNLYTRESIEAEIVEIAPPGSRERIHLLVQKSDVIDHTIRIPATAKAYAEKLVQDIISRKTPYSADSMVVGLTIGNVDKKHINVRFVALPIERLSLSLTRLQIERRQVAAVEVHDRHPVGVFTINLLPKGGHSRAGSLFERIISIAGAIGAGVVISMVAFAVLQFLELRETRSEKVRLQAISSAGQSAMAEARSGHNKLANWISFAESASLPSIWEELSTVVPASTYLSEVKFDGLSSTLSGQTSSASELLDGISKSKMFRDVTFTGPIVLDAQSGRSRFSISMLIAGSKRTIEDIEP